MLNRRGVIFAPLPIKKIANYQLIIEPLRTISESPLPVFGDVKKSRS
jgi:hypothetical protein